MVSHFVYSQLVNGLISVLRVLVAPSGHELIVYTFNNSVKLYLYILLISHRIISMNEIKKKRGRPVGSKANVTADAVLPPIRVKRAQLDAYKAKADKEGKSLSGWVKEALDKEVKSR